MKNIIFYPKYRLRGSSDVLSLTLFGFLGVAGLFIWGGATPLALFLLVVNILFIINFSEQYIRRIEFTPTHFLVVRYTRLPKIISYSDITDLGYYKVKSSSDEISFTAISNLQELRAIFLKLVQDGKIDGPNLGKSAVIEELVNEKAFRPAIITCTILGILVFYLWLHFLGLKNFYLSFLGLLATELSVCFSAIAIIKWYYKKHIK